MSLNPTGPISQEELQRIADLPYGQAGAALRQHDPLWGTTAGDADAQPPLRKWRVKFHQEVVMRGFVEVDARTEDEAIHNAELLPNITCDDFAEEGSMWAVSAVTAPVEG